MKTFASVLASAAFAILSASTALAQPVSIEKQASYIQTSSSGAVLASTVGFPAYFFSAQTRQSSSQTGSFTPPGGSATAIPFDSDQGLGVYFQTYSSLAALNSAFPNGNYTLSYTGSPTLTIPLSGDLYPSAIPQITGGTWQNNVLVVDSTKAATLNFTPFTGYASTSGGQVAGHMSVKISSLDGDNVNIDQEIISTPIGGGPTTVTTTPLTSYTIPANTLQPGYLYQVTLDYDVLTKLDTTTIASVAIAGIYENELNFYLVAQPIAPPAPAPTVVFQPANVSAPLGSTASFVSSFMPTALANNSGGNQTNGIWYFNGQGIQTSTKYKINFSSPSNTVSAEFLTISNVTAADAGTYVLVATNGSGVAYSQPVTLTIGPAAIATITGQPPAAVTLNPGGGTTLMVGFVGAGPFTYQWFLNGKAIAGATASSYVIAGATAAASGTYSVAITNSAGTTTSNGTVLTVTGQAGSTLPVFTQQPAGQLIASGSTVVFNAAATGVPVPTYQWKFNSGIIPGATSARLVITNATAVNAGPYSCTATNSAGSVVSTAPVLTVISTTNVGRLVNLSVNTTAGKSQVLTVGFVSGGSGTTGSENLLIRATGPALAGLGVPNTLADPTLSVLNGSTVLVSNDNWATPTTNQAAVTAADTATFAFPLTNPASLDAAVAQAFPAGADTAQVSGNTAASGTTLAEVYDNTPTASYTPATPRLINLSAKNQIVAGSSMTAGFVVGGSTAKTVLIRATGPALFLLGVPGALPDPQIALHTTVNNQDTVLATNAGWGGDPQITAVSNSVFAFPLTNPASADSVVLVTLAPGAYTAIASSVNGAMGTVLIEVYEVP